MVQFYFQAVLFPDPFQQALEYTLKGVKSTQAKDPNQHSQTRLLVTPKILWDVR